MSRSRHDLAPDNSICDDGLEAIAGALARNSTLIKIDLCGKQNMDADNPMRMQCVPTTLAVTGTRLVTIPRRSFPKHWKRILRSRTSFWTASQDMQTARAPHIAQEPRSKRPGLSVSARCFRRIPRSQRSAWSASDKKSGGTVERHNHYRHTHPHSRYD